LTGKGRIYKVFDPGRTKDAAVVEVKKLLADGFTKHSDMDVARLLDHADQRVRQEAQFALAERKAIELLEHGAAEGRGLARLHAIWGLGQIGCTKPAAYDLLPKLARDTESEVRAQAIKVLGDGRVSSGYAAMLAGLTDLSPRVPFFAGIALG